MAASTLGFYQQGGAQIKNDRGTFEKPVKGNVLVELTLTPNLTGGNIFQLNDNFLQNLVDDIEFPLVGGDGGDFKAPGQIVLPMLKARYMNSDNSAFRGQFNLAIGSKTEKGGGGDVTTSQTGIAIALGYEKHMAGAERLSTYFGGDVLIGYAKQSLKGSSETSASGFGFGLRGVTGFDYYFIPKVYLGVELGYGLSFRSYGDVTIAGTTVKDSGSSTISLSPFAATQLRIGYRF